MASLREQVLARTQAAMQAAAPLGSGDPLSTVQAASVFRARETGITRSVSPAIVVMPGATDTERRATNADRHAFEFAVEIFVRGDPWSSLADPIDVAAHAAIYADFLSSGAGALGSIVSDLRRIGEEFESQEADRTAGTLTVRYRAVFLTQAGAIDKVPLV